MPKKMRADPVQIRSTPASLSEIPRHWSLTAVANKATPPMANVPSRTGKIQTIRTEGCFTALGRYKSRTKRANILARPIADHRMHLLATRLNAAARWATPTKYVRNRRGGIHLGTNAEKPAAAVKCSPAKAASDAAIKTGPSTVSESRPLDATESRSRR